MCLKEGEDSGDSIFLIGEEKGEESDELHFYCSFWKYY